MAHYVVQKVKYRVFGWDKALDFSTLLVNILNLKSICPGDSKPVLKLSTHII